MITSFLLRRGSALLAVSYLLFLGLPILTYVTLAGPIPVAPTIMHYVVATAYAFTSVMMLIEAATALPRRRAPIEHSAVGEDLPMVTIIVSAYLPNEQDLIAETLVHISTELNVPSYKMQIILAYNTPSDLPVEDVIERLQGLSASFLPIRVHGSTSKAENIIAALPHISGEMTVLLDADHHPHPDAVARAYRWLASGYDIVQGRCVVRHQKTNRFTRYIAIEFEQMYGVAHAGRSIGMDTAIFGGTNGFWRTDVLRAIAMDPSMLTEDIDASIRASLAGYRLIHDRSVISTELATANLKSWWHQRLRWSQGWFQVALRHQGAIWRSQTLSRKHKAYWTYMLSWRELFPFLSLQIFALLAAGHIVGTGFSWFTSPYLFATTILTLVSGPLYAIVTYRVALWRTKQSLRWWFVIAALTALPYTTLKNAVAMVAMCRELLGGREWVVTRRPPAVARPAVHPA